MQIIVALLSGIVFGLGLILSGMTNPTKVIGFLDLAGLWDPSLGFVMGGAIMVVLPATRWATRLKQSMFGGPMRVPDLSGFIGPFSFRNEGSGC